MPQMKRRDETILRKLLAEIQVLRSIIGSISRDDFFQDEMRKRASSMTLINIGELVKNLSDECKALHADVPWKAISGLRDVTAHRYHTLDMGDIWATIVDDIPVFEKKIVEMMNA